MDFIKDAQAVLDYIATQAGIDPFTFDSEGRAFFEANDLSFLFYGMEEEQALVVAIYIGQPDLSDAQLLYNILCGNHLWEFTGGGHLSIDRETGHLVLSHILDLPLENVEEAEPFMGNLLGAAEYWKGILAGAEEKTQPASQAPLGNNFIRV